jgi:thymidylate kinase
MDERDRIIARMQKRIEELEYLVDLQRKTIKTYEDLTDALSRGKYRCLETNRPNRLVQRIRRIEYRK